MRAGLSTLIATISLLGPVSALAQAPDVRFSRACEPGESLVIGAVGDILPHTPLQKQAYGSRDGFKSLWTKIIPQLQAADITYGNLEGPAAEGVTRGGRAAADPGLVYDGKVYTGTDFVFNYHPRIIRDLLDSGFDIVSNANNHAMDRGLLGMDRTIEALDREGLQHVGSRKSDDRSSEWYTVTRKNGFSVAWIACTEHLNGMPDKMGQVLRCGDVNSMTSEIQRLFQDRGQDRGIDAIIVTPHWGEEYKLQPESSQVKLAKRWLEAGATAVIGSHPHVLEPMQKYVTKDGRETLIAYSMGNFVSGQGSTTKKLTALLYLGLTKRNGERAWINGVSYHPLWMDRGPHSVNLLEDSRQAPKIEAYNLISSLLDPSRMLRATDAVRTNVECR